jgi:hypothetical protein
LRPSARARLRCFRDESPRRIGRGHASGAFEFHPLANLFPLLDGPEFDELVADIKAHGLHEPVVVWQGRILDGRNRVRACQAAGVTATFSHFEPELHGDALAFIVSKNLRRRHLNDDQRRMVAARIANLGRGRPDENAATCGISRANAAALVNADLAGTEQARTVIAKVRLPSCMRSNAAS